MICALLCPCHSVKTTRSGHRCSMFSKLTSASASAYFSHSAMTSSTVQALGPANVIVLPRVSSLLKTAILSCSCSFDESMHLICQMVCCADTAALGMNPLDHNERDPCRLVQHLNAICPVGLGQKSYAGQCAAQAWQNLLLLDYSKTMHHQEGKRQCHEAGDTPESSQSHPSNILAVQVRSARVIAGSPYLLVLQYWDRVVTNDSLHMWQHDVRHRTRGRSEQQTFLCKFRAKIKKVL